MTAVLRLVHHALKTTAIYCDHTTFVCLQVIHLLLVQVCYVTHKLYYTCRGVSSGWLRVLVHPLSLAYLTNS